MAERRCVARQGKSLPTCNVEGNHSSFTYPTIFGKKRSEPTYGWDHIDALLDGNEEVRDGDYEGYAKRGKRNTRTIIRAGCDGLGKEIEGGIAHLCGNVGGNRT